MKERRNGGMQEGENLRMAPDRHTEGIVYCATPSAKVAGKDAQQHFLHLHFLFVRQTYSILCYFIFCSPAREKTNSVGSDLNSEAAFWQRICNKERCINVNVTSSSAAVSFLFL